MDILLKKDLHLYQLWTDIHHLAKLSTLLLMVSPNMIF